MRAWAVIRAAYLGVVDEREAAILRAPRGLED